MELPPVKVSLGRLAILFAAQYLVMFAVIVAIIFAMETFFNISFDSNVMGVIIPFVAAMTLGNNYVSRAGTRPSGGFSWLVALICALISLVLAYAIVIGFYSLGVFPELDEMRRDPDAAMILAAVSLGLGLFLMLICRLGFGLGVKQGLKLREKQQAKAG